MLKRLRRAHPVGYCLLTEVVFLAVLMVVPVLLVLLLALLGVDLTRVDDYFLSAIQELLGALVAVFFLKKTDRLGLLRRRGSGFFNGRTITTVDAVHFRCRHLDHSADRHVIRVRYDSSIIFIQIYPKQFASVIFQHLCRSTVDFIRQYKISEDWTLFDLEFFAFLTINHRTDHVSRQ